MTYFQCLYLHGTVVVCPAVVVGTVVVGAFVVDVTDSENRRNINSGVYSSEYSSLKSIYQYSADFADPFRKEVGRGLILS